MKSRKMALILILITAALLLTSCSSGGNGASKTYDEALSAMSRGRYQEAARKLADISFYMDSAQLALYCRAHAKAAEGDYSFAITELQKLGSYRDSSQSAAYFQARQSEELANSPWSRAHAADLYEQSIIDGFRDSTARADAIRKALYRDGLSAQKNEEWMKSASIFEALDGYEDSHIRYCYVCGRESEEHGEQSAVSYAYAVKYYDEAGRYLDSAERKNKCLTTAMEQAGLMIEEKEFDKVESIYNTLGSYCSSEALAGLQNARAEAEEEAHQEKMAQAAVLMEKGSFDEAKEIYLSVDEPEMANEAIYQKAGYLISHNQEEEGAALYLEIREYKDSRNKHYQTGLALKENNPETASHILLMDREYPGAEQDLYEIALKATDEKNYPLSISIYNEFRGKNDCTLRLTSDLYLYGLQLLEGKEPELAADTFEQISGVGSADLYEKMARYAAAENLEERGSYAAAAQAFLMLKDYSDSAACANRCRYQQAQVEKTEGKYLEAADLFDQLGEHEDSIEQAKECRYLQAQKYQSNEEWNKAIDLYKALNEYEASTTLKRECYIGLGGQCLAENKPEEAYSAYSLANDASGKARAAFAAGEAEMAKMNLEKALVWYKRAVDLPETEERTSMIAQSLLNMEEDEMSEQYASTAENSERSQAVLYALALRSLERKDEEAAMRQMKKAGNNTDASERFQKMLSARVEALVKDEKYDDAIYLCSSYGDQERIYEINTIKEQKEKEKEQKRLEAEEEERQKALEEERKERDKKIEEASQLMTEKKYEEAAAIYKGIGENELAENALALKKEAEEEEKKAEKERIQKKENEAASLLKSGEYDEAIRIYQELNETEMVNEAVYQKAAGLNMPELYMQILEYKDSREQHYLAGKNLLATNPEEAYKILVEDLSYSDAQALLYKLAVEESQKGHYRLSADIYKTLSEQPLNPQEMRSDCAMCYYQNRYQYGLQLQEAGDWDDAITVFSEVEDLGEARTHILECHYSAAAELDETGKYNQAALAFDNLGDYNDSIERANQSRYSAAVAMEKDGNYIEAAEAFDKLRNYSDSKEQAKRNRYLAAQKLMDSEALEMAASAFDELDDYSDAEQKAKECWYLRAEGLMLAGEYEEAKSLFDRLEDYSDAQVKKQECIYQTANLKKEQKEYEEAIESYQLVSEYLDAEDKILECHILIAESLINKGDEALRNGEVEIAIPAYEAAYEEYSAAQNNEKQEQTALLIGDCYYSNTSPGAALKWYSNAGNPGKQRIVRVAEYYFLTEQFEMAEKMALQSGLEEGKELLYRIGEQKLAEGNEDEAIRLFEEAGDALDAKQRHDSILFERALRMMEKQEYAQAIEILDSIPDYEGVKAKLQEALYDLAVTVERIETLDEKTKKIARKAISTYVTDMVAQKKYEEAISVLEKAERNTVNMQWLASIRYEYAESLESSGDYEKAAHMYSSVGSYQDAIAKADKMRYFQAAACMEAQEYDQALQLFSEIPDYEDAKEQMRECLYQKAGMLLSAGEAKAAFQAYQSINEYKDTKEIITGSPELRSELAAWQHSISAGDQVCFGSRQSGEPYNWLVLDREEDYILLISLDSTEEMPFMKGDPSRTTWAHSTLRDYLNGEFLRNVFSEEERHSIRLSKVKAEKNPASNASPGNNTEDYVYVLNLQEVMRYSQHLVQPVYLIESWLRTPGGTRSNDNEIMTFYFAPGKKETVFNDVKATESRRFYPMIWVSDNAFIDKVDRKENQDNSTQVVFTLSSKEDQIEENDTNSTEQIKVSERIGIQYRELTDEDIKQGRPRKGMLILQVDENSPAQQAGLKPGDVITGAGASMALTNKQLDSALQSENTNILKVRRMLMSELNPDNSYTIEYENGIRKIALPVKKQP